MRTKPPLRVALGEAETMARSAMDRDWWLVREEESERERGADIGRGEREGLREREADGEKDK